MSTNPISATKLLLYSANKKITRLFKKFLITDADYGGPFTTITGYIILTIFAVFFQGMELTSYPNSAISGDGITVWVYFYCSLLLLFPTHMSRHSFFHKKCGPKVNSIANIVCLFLGILFEKFYKESMASLYAAFLFAVFFLIVLVLLRPSTDLGFFGFILGAIGSISYNLFAFSGRFWISIAVCFLMFCFKGWLDKNWIEEYKARDSAFLFRVQEGELIEPPKTTSFEQEGELIEPPKTTSFEQEGELIEPPKTTSFEHDKLLQFTNDPTLANNSCSISTRVFITNSVVYSLKCWLARVEEDRLKTNTNVEDDIAPVPLLTMSDEEYQLLQVAFALLNLTYPKENQRVRDFDRDDCDAVVATICYLIFYFKLWLVEENRGWPTNVNDDEFLRVMPTIATNNLDEGQLEFLRITNNVRLQRALHSSLNMDFAMQGQAFVNGCLIWRIGAFRIRGEVISWTFIIVSASISVVVFIFFVSSFIGFFPQFKLNFVHGRYLRRRRN